MATDDMIRNEKLEHGINTKIVKISAISSRKIDKYEYLTGEKKAPSDRRGVIERTKFTYSPLGNTIEKKEKQSRINVKIR